MEVLEDGSETATLCGLFGPRRANADTLADISMVVCRAGKKRRVTIRQLECGHWRGGSKTWALPGLLAGTPKTHPVSTGPWGTRPCFARIRHSSPKLGPNSLSFAVNHLKHA